jgi:hypothetical protein
MIAEIFKVDSSGKYHPTANALGIPEFHNLWFNVEYPDLYFRYIHYLLFPLSAYSDYPESERESYIHKDFPINKNNPYFIIALEKAESMYESSLKRMFIATKHSCDTVSYFMSTIDGITFGKDGNYTDVASFLKTADNMMENYLKVEGRYKETISTYGTRQLGFDEKFNYLDEEVDLN